MSHKEKIAFQARVVKFIFEISQTKPIPATSKVPGKMGRMDSPHFFGRPKLKHRSSLDI
jgi:hypothetical protein